MKTVPVWLLPEQIGVVLARLPAYPGSALLVAALNRALVPNLPADVRAILSGRGLRIHVRDARLTFDFSCDGDRFTPRAGGQVADLTISASAHDFLRLAQRQEDPDTLFFSRRLSMQGDTELGLVVKNTLDALESPVFDLRRWTPSQVLARFDARRAGAKPSRRAGD